MVNLLIFRLRNSFMGKKKIAAGELEPLPDGTSWFALLHDVVLKFDAHGISDKYTSAAQLTTEKKSVVKLNNDDVCICFTIGDNQFSGYGKNVVAAREQAAKSALEFIRFACDASSIQLGAPQAPNATKYWYDVLLKTPAGKRKGKGSRQKRKLEILNKYRNQVEDKLLPCRHCSHLNWVFKHVSCLQCRKPIESPY